jgi:hypothetical protein
VTAAAFLQDVLARIVRSREALEDGEPCLAWEILRDLEADISSWREAA